MTTDPLWEAARRTEQWKEEFLSGRALRAVELLREALAICERHGLTKHYLYLKAHVDLYRIYRALGHDASASEHFQQAVRLGANESLLRVI